MTEISLYNTRTRSKERFEPIDPGNVRMYVCGPTVYDRAHIGNARPVVVFDVLYRLLRHVYGEGHVTYVRNFTDVDDKINARAAAEKRPIRELTDETIGWYHADMGALGVLTPDQEPRATEFIPQMVAMIGTLIERGHAYAAEGHVLFSVASFPEYGRFANRSLDEMQAGARIEVAPYKRDPMDFVLWKPSNTGRAGLAFALGAWAAGMAYRVLGDESGVARGVVRHSWRGDRSGLSAPRERDRPEPVRASGGGVCAVLDAQRVPQRGGGEDVEIARQLLHGAGFARQIPSRVWN